MTRTRGAGIVPSTANINATAPPRENPARTWKSSCSLFRASAAPEPWRPGFWRSSGAPLLAGGPVIRVERPCWRRRSGADTCGVSVLVATTHSSAFWTAALPLLRKGWAAFPVWARAPWVLVMVAAGGGTVVLGAQLGGADFLEALSTWTYVVVPLPAGVFLMLAARWRRGPGFAGWTLIGLGVAFWGIGELAWNYSLYVLGDDLPYPGIADIFYVAAYPMIFAGVLVLPHLRAGKWERARLTLDALAGTVALSAVTWEFYVGRVVDIEPELGLLENTVDLAYPIGDLLLLMAVMILATRRSARRFDSRLLVTGFGIILTAIADMMFVFQVDGDVYLTGGRIDAIWLAAYGLFALVALLVAVPPRISEQADRPSRLWPMIAPYAAIGVLFILTTRELGGEATILQIGTATVGLLIIARQMVAIRETRHLVEKQRNDLVASISHELRTPLTAMRGFVEILDEDPDLERSERSEMLSIVAEQTRHLSRIVGDLIDVSRNRLETAPLEMRPISVADLVGSAVGMITVDPASSLTADVEGGLTLVGDLDRLRQVVVNYLTNAIRYGGGRVEICARAIEHGVLIEVHDDGPGIPKKYELTIWERFERGPHTYMSRVQGSGLGLAIARQLVNAHGGRTGHRPSERLGGACFWLMIPAPDSMRTAGMPRALVSA